MASLDPDRNPPDRIEAEVAMSWSELERLVADAEDDGVIRRGLRHCRSRHELVLAAQRLGYRIEGEDLRQAWALHHADHGGWKPTTIEPGPLAAPAPMTRTAPVIIPRHPVAS
jgi:hypothetical protein